MISHSDDPATDDNIHIRVYDADVSTLEEARAAEPKREYEVHNVTRTRLHEAVVGQLNGDGDDLTVDKFALGDDDSDTSLLADGAVLGNELFRTSITDPRRDGSTYRASIFIDSTEANGDSYFEGALVAETGSGDRPINRFTISSPLLDPKESGETVTVDVDITVSDA